MSFWSRVTDVPDKTDIFVGNISQPLIVHFKSGYTLSGAYYSHDTNEFMWMGQVINDDWIDFWDYDYSALVSYVEMPGKR